jgi:hypothetical protein
VLGARRWGLPLVSSYSNILYFSGVRAVSGGLFFLISAMLFLSCSTFVGTPMLGHEYCRNLPTVEECQAEAARLITDHCLRDCIIDQCRKARPHCNAQVVAKCSELSATHAEGRTGGFVPRGPQTCERPGKELNWCQVEQSPRCQAQAMVHEAAHMCGWHDAEVGKGVPGEDGRFQCL